jgi:hypothetical protein
MRLIPRLALAATLLAGCSRTPAPDDAAASTGTPTNAPADEQPAGVPATAAVAGTQEPAGVKGLVPLARAGVFPVIRNNALEALRAWDSGDYVGAIVSVRTIMSLPQAAPYTAQVDGAFEEMLAALKPAAASGNRSAKDALEYVQSILPAQ